MKILLYLLLGIVLFRFVFYFLLPLFRVTHMAGTKLRNLQREMEEMQRRNRREPPPVRESKQGDYIDYEEIK
jgi:hypothetical protein